MKIAFVSQPLDKVVPPNQNSIGIWTYQIARRLGQQHEVLIYLSTRRKSEEVEATERFQYRYIRIRKNRIFQIFDRLLTPLLNGDQPVPSFDFASLLFCLKVAWDLKRHRCKIVHIHNFSQFAPLIRFFNPQARIVIHMHCEWLTQLDPQMIGSRLRQVDLILGVSEYITKKVRARFPQMAGKCRTIFNGVDIDQFWRAHERPAQENPDHRLLFTGRVSPEKGIHDLIEAYKLVAMRDPHTSLHIVGDTASLPKEFLVNLSEESQVAGLTAFYDGNYLDHLRQQIPLELQDRVTFYGFVPSSKIASHYQTADILINPSYSESFGMSLVEAMASEVPVVATRVGGMIEIVTEGETGLLVERGDTRALAEALVYLLRRDELRLSMGQKGRARVLACYSWERISEKLLEYYVELEDLQQRVQ